MKCINIKDNVEGYIHVLSDAALKGAGMTVQGCVYNIINNVQSTKKEEPRQLELTPEMDKNLHAVCDAALKYSGIESHSVVQSLIDSVIDVV